MIHVILEGIAPLEIKCVMKHLILLGQLDLDVLNIALVGFHTLLFMLEINQAPQQWFSTFFWASAPLYIIQVAYRPPLNIM